MTATPTAATPTPEQRAYAIVQPLTVDSVTRRDALVTRIAAAIRQHSAPLEAQIAEMRAENERLRREALGSRLVKEVVAENAQAIRDRATQAEAALAAMTKERDEAWYDEAASALARTEAEMALSAALERERLMREALSVAYDLSTWAACINWRARNKDNQGEWLDELKELITRTQQLVEPLIKPLPADIQPKEPAHDR